VSAWVYMQSEPGLYTVGFYKPDGSWEAESDHTSEQQAAARVHYLNGGLTGSEIVELIREASAR
jgi:hypothetical protein